MAPSMCCLRTLTAGGEHTCPSLIKSGKNLFENLVIDFFHLSSSHDARFFNSVKLIKFVSYLLSNSAPHEPRCFLASVFERLQQNRAAASCAAGRHYPGRTCATWRTLRLPRASSAPGEPSFEHPQASWGPLPARFRSLRKLVSSAMVDTG